MPLPSKTNIIIERFFECIEKKQILAGNQLSQAELSKYLDTSISPLRDALKILEHQGFIKILPRSGIEICSVGLQLTKDCFQLRSMLESCSTRLFVKYGDDKLCKKIYDAHIKLKQRLKDNENTETINAELNSLDIELHSMLIKSSNNQITYNVYRENMSRISLIRIDSKYRFTKHTLLLTINEHIKILEAIIDGDPTEAGNQMENHISHSMHRAMRT